MSLFPLVVHFDSSSHKTSGPFNHLLTFSWFDGDIPRDVVFAGLDFESTYIHWLTSDFSRIDGALFASQILKLFLELKQIL